MIDEIIQQVPGVEVVQPIHKQAHARRDVEHGLRITLDHYRTREAQERMLEILQFKLDVLWSMLDAMSMAYELDRPPYHTVTRDRVWHKGISF